MNSSWIEPPPPQRGMGCLGKGCLILFCFILFLAIAFAGGTYLAVRILKTSYFPITRVVLPETTATQEQQDAALAKWNEFDKAAREHKEAHLEMTADELNALIAATPDLRGKALVSIENDIAQLRLSIPLDVKWLRGRYVNAECTVQAANDGDPTGAHISHIMINDKAIEDESLNWRGPWSLRRYLENWTEKSRLKTFEIDEGRVILETRGEENSGG